MSPLLLPADVTRFVLTSIPSVPHLEALLLLHQDAGVAWHAKDLGQRLYIPEKNAEALLHDLTGAGILKYDDVALTFQFSPVSATLAELIDKLAVVYAKNIVEISNLIHSKPSNQVQQFADAFKLRKDS